jgi:hypothetical protein
VAGFRDARGAERYAQAALEWGDRLGDPVAHAKAVYLVHAYVYPLTRPRRSVLAPLRATAERLFELGDDQFTAYSLLLRLVHMVLTGEPLGLVQQEYDVLATKTRGEIEQAIVLYDRGGAKAKADALRRAAGA